MSRSIRTGMLCSLLVSLLGSAKVAEGWIVSSVPRRQSSPPQSSFSVDLRRISIPPIRPTTAASPASGRTVLLQSSATAPDDNLNSKEETSSTTIRLDDLMEMDVVVYSEKKKKSGDNERQLGAVQEDGRVTPVCVWSLEPAFDESLEFLVDEEDLLPGLASDDEIEIYAIVPQEKLSYGSRQVGGGMGPGNPHGEESELLYYVDQSIIEEHNIQVELKPELEIFW